MGGGFFGDSVEVVHFLVKWVGKVLTPNLGQGIFLQ